MSDTIEKVSIIISKGSLEGVYPGTDHGQRGHGPKGSRPTCSSRSSVWTPSIKKRHEHIKVATVGNPGMHMRHAASARSRACRRSPRTMMEQKMEKLDIPSIPEFIEMIADTGCRHCTPARRRSTCSASRRTISSSRCEDIITVGEFYEKAAGGEIIFT